MENSSTRLNDINKLISKLDISASMYKNAVDKYKNIATFLEDNGIKCSFYPQGSFSLGTIVRPYRNNKDANYDLDAICQILLQKSQTTPKAIKEQIENQFESNALYAEKLTKYDKCCTISYAEKDGFAFSIDIVSAVDEDEILKNHLMQSCEYPQFINTTIAIPSKINNQYNWATNNPKGYKAWFDQINSPFLIANPLVSRNEIFMENRSIFASIEDIPYELERSALQRVIQIFKRHRDLYFSKRQNGDKLKPNSAIITTLVTNIAKNAQHDLNIIDLLKYVLMYLELYSHKQNLSFNEFTKIYGVHNIIKRDNDKWIIENPVNPRDNLADSWNNDFQIPKAFFEWIKIVSADFSNLIEKNDYEFTSSLENSLGYEFVSNNIDFINSKEIKIITPDIIIQSKPWRSNGNN